MAASLAATLPAPGLPPLAGSFAAAVERRQRRRGCAEGAHALGGARERAADTLPILVPGADGSGAPAAASHMLQVAARDPALFVWAPDAPMVGVKRKCALHSPATEWASG